MASLLFLSIQNRSGRKCSRMANSSALPFPIPSGGEDVVPLDEGIRDCGVWITTSVTAEVHLGLGTWCKRNEGTRFCGDSCTKSEAAERRTTETRRRNSSDRHASGPDSLFFRNERSRCTKCTAASSIYYAFLGLQVQRRSPRRPAAPRPRGEARTACTSRAYIGRLGMRTVKVVPLPGMLST